MMTGIKFFSLENRGRCDSPIGRKVSQERETVGTSIANIKPVSYIQCSVRQTGWLDFIHDCFFFDLTATFSPF